jgi:hypothetical protein
VTVYLFAEIPCSSLSSTDIFSKSLVNSKVPVEMSVAFRPTVIGIRKPSRTSTTLKILGIIKEINKIWARSILTYKTKWRYFWRDTEVISKSEFLRLMAFEFTAKGWVGGTVVIVGGVETEVPMSPAARRDSSSEPVFRSDGGGSEIGGVAGFGGTD